MQKIGNIGMEVANCINAISEVNNLKRETMDYSEIEINWGALESSMNTPKQETRGRKPGSTKKSSEEKTPSQLNKELAEALKESELSDSKFLKQYAEKQKLNKIRRNIKILEKANIDSKVAKAKDIENRKRKVIAKLETKDFVYQWWELQGGGIHKEVICRMGLRIGLDEKDQELNKGFKIVIEG